MTEDSSEDVATRETAETDVATVPSLSLTPDGTIRFVNDAWLTLTGHDRETVVGDAFTTFISDEQAAAVDAIIEDVHPGRSITCDVAIDHADGLAVPVRLTGEVEASGDGAVNRIHCQATPKTAMASGTLVEQNALLRALLDGLPVGVLAETADRTVLTVNDELLSLFEISQERADVIGADCVTLAEKASDDFVDPAAFVTGIENRIADGEPVLGEYLERTDGQIFKRSYLPIELPRGRGHLWIYEDVTGEQQRKTELETYKRLVQVAPVGVFRTTTDGRVLTTNQRMANILGYEDEAALLESYETLERDLYVDSQRRRTFLDRLRADGLVEDFEYEARTKDGGRRWLSMNARLLDERDDGARVITGFTWDLTDRKRHERQLAILGRILRHNLRNALTVIEGQADLLATGTAETPEAARQKIEERADKLLALADKERAIVHLLRGTTDQVTRDVCTIAKTVRDDIQSQYPTATVELTAPESAPASMCAGFERAIAELLENAIVHLESGEPRVSVTIGADEETVTIEIADNGPGIPEIEQRVLRGEADESPLYHSSGIGLFLVRQLVEASNGRITVEEDGSQGSVVRITLQRARE